jgi:hypothetical protein
MSTALQPDKLPTFAEIADQRHQVGIDEYRGGDPTRAFEGDAAYEYVMELADARNYAREERKAGPAWYREAWGSVEEQASALGELVLRLYRDKG